MLCCLGVEVQRGAKGNAAQRWVIRNAGNGYVNILNVRLSNEIGTLMVLDYHENAPVGYLETIRGKTGNTAQRWKLQDAGDGLKLIQNQRLSEAKATSMVLDYNKEEYVYLESHRGERVSARS